MHGESENYTRVSIRNFDKECWSISMAFIKIFSTDFENEGFQINPFTYIFLKYSVGQVLGS